VTRASACDPSAMPLESDIRHSVAVQHPLALILGKHALLAGLHIDPARQLRVLDSIGHQLGSEVLVITAGVVGWPPQREISVRALVEDDDRPSVFLRIAGIDADTARKLLPVESSEE
jgi:hypothetical protein